MKRFLKLATATDVLIILILIGISFLPFVVFYSQMNAGGERIVVIKRDQDVLHEINLSDVTDLKEITIEADNGDYNTIHIENNDVLMHDANCNDQVCVRSGAIDSPGETIVCLPHKVIVEIKADDAANDDNIDIISSFISVKGVNYE